MPTRHRLLVPCLAVLLLASTAQAQKKINNRAYAAKRTYAIKKAIAGKFQGVTGLATAPKQIRISSQTPLYVSSGPKGNRGAGLDTRTVDFSVVAKKNTYLGNSVSHTARADPSRTRLSFFALTQRKRALTAKKIPTTRGSSFLRSLARTGAANRTSAR